MKNILIIFFLLIVFGGNVFAEEENDCDIVSASFTPFSLLSSGDIEIARSHLRSYCCVAFSASFQAKDYIGDGKCSNLVLGPESPYWYDHFIDVGMRKLDARSWQLYPGMIPDSDGLNWVNYLSTSKKKSFPLDFSSEYQKYWNINKYISSSSQENYQTLSDLTLRDKYLFLCDEALFLYQQQGSISNTYDNYYDTCISLVSDKINKEIHSARLISEYSSFSLFNEGLSSYMNYFLQKRLMVLYDKLVAIRGLFDILSRQAPLSSQCTQ